MPGRRPIEACVRGRRRRRPGRGGLMGTRGKSKLGFENDVLSSIRTGRILGIRAGTEPHRTIGIWAVVVEDRVFVRSWSLKPRSWYRTFREEPRGVIEVDGRTIEVRAVFTRR